MLSWLLLHFFVEFPLPVISMRTLILGLLFMLLLVWRLRNEIDKIIAALPMYCFCHILATEGWSSPIVEQLFIPNLKSYLWYAIGLGFYLSRIPERFSPGMFDYWVYYSRWFFLNSSQGQSHQIWHFCVVMGMWTLYVGIRNTIRFRLSLQGQCGLVQ